MFWFQSIAIQDPGHANNTGLLWIAETGEHDYLNCKLRDDSMTTGMDHTCPKFKWHWGVVGVTWVAFLSVAMAGARKGLRVVHARFVRRSCRIENFHQASSPGCLPCIWACGEHRHIGYRMNRSGETNGCQRFHVSTVCNIGDLKPFAGRCAFIWFGVGGVGRTCLCTLCFTLCLHIHLHVFFCYCVFVLDVCIHDKAWYCITNIASTNEKCNLLLDSCRGFENKPVAKHVMDFACGAPRRGRSGQLAWNETSLDVFFSPFCIRTFSGTKKSARFHLLLVAGKFEPLVWTSAETIFQKVHTCFKL